MVQIDSIGPQKKRIAKSRKPKKPASKKQRPELSPIKFQKKTIFWLLITFSIIIIIIFWGYLLRISLNRGDQAEDSGIFGEFGDLGERLSDIMDNFRGSLGNTNSSNQESDQVETSGEIKELEEKVFPQFKE